MGTRPISASRPKRADHEHPVVRGAEPFEPFFKREYPKMVAIAYAMSGSRWAAEELAQEAMLRAYRAWATISGYDKPGAWLRRVTINLSSSLIRRRLSELKALERAAISDVRPFEVEVGDDEEFWVAVKMLPRRQREVIVLKFIDDMSTADIATLLEISESAARTHLQRARETLVARFSDSGGAQT
jgi:RNA polymerase sigma-70 factor, ECF subfamily